MRERVKVVFACAGAALLLGTGSVSAHHALITEFDLAKPLTIRGTLTKMEWVNPHGWIYVDAKGSDGRVVNWKFETGAPLRMQKRGLKKADFRVGEDVIITGFPSKNGGQTVAGMTITFPARQAQYPAREATFVLGR